MSINQSMSRREFLKQATTTLGGAALAPRSAAAMWQQPGVAADYTLRIAAAAIEIAPKRFVSTVVYNGQFPGPLLRFAEGQPAIVDVYNDTSTPEQLHWHGQMVPSDVDGAAEEGTPFIPAHASRRIVLTPRPAGLRFYHTHNRAGADLHAGQYSGQVGPVYIASKREAGHYDREVFLTLKEFEPSFSQGGDMDQDFLPPASMKDLEESGESLMKASTSKGVPKGFEVGYRYFTINGRMLGHGDPVKVKRGERVLFHVLNGRAHFQSGRPRRQYRADGGGSSGIVAWHRGTHFSGRRNELSRRVDYGRSCG
jgi:FtsP/CotA-like multicopper oxidase with cupredoxin domain